MTDLPQARNLLAGQSSPYLLQHAANPVHWRPWGDAALTEARQTNKPILLSIGYAACHWCHVMAHESFENAEIARLMNQLYVNVKVDREERPDVDQVYMAALHAMGEQGGWPLTMFLTPDARPFWGGTYFPPDPRYGRPGFRQVLQAVENAFRQQPGDVEKNAAALQDHLLALSAAPDAPQAPAQAVFHAFAERLLTLHDEANGGIRGAPKFPNAPMTEIWLRAARGNVPSPHAKAFLHTMERISQGGIYDHLGGGIARYSTDEIWLVPHFEKMLYDNAHYIRLLTRAWQIDQRKLFRDRIEETIAWLARELGQPGGGFAASLDADSQGQEGRYYVWTNTEIGAALGNDATLFSQAYGVTQAGNFPDSNFTAANILNRLNAVPISAENDQRLADCRTRLLAIRDQRIRPGLDDKVLADWNGYAIRALAEAGFAFDRPDWIELARNAFRFICESMSKNLELSHSWRHDVQVRPALATDYGAMMNAAISLNLATGNALYLDTATQWLAILDADYADRHNGYFLTSAKATDLGVRPRADADEANPSGASQILEAIARLARLTGNPAHLHQAHRLAGNLHAATMNSPYGNAGFCNSLDTLLNGRHAKLFVTEEAEAKPWLDVLRHTPDPALTWQLILPENKSGPSDTHFGMQLIPPANPPAAILCTDNACSAPLTNPAAFSKALAPASIDT